MAIEFFTVRGQAGKLLQAFQQRIAQSQPTGKITTWVPEFGGYTHVAQQWYRQAWFVPEIYDNRLRFVIHRANEHTVSTVAYAYYHGHLAETFLAHFDKQFLYIVTSALAVEGDIVT